MGLLPDIDKNGKIIKPPKVKRWRFPKIPQNWKQSDEDRLRELNGMDREEMTEDFSDQI